MWFLKSGSASPLDHGITLEVNSTHCRPCLPLYIPTYRSHVTMDTARDVTLTPQARAVLKDFAPHHQKKIRTWLSRLGDPSFGSVPASKLHEVSSDQSVWLLEVPPKFYAYFRFDDQTVQVIDITPKERIRAMGFGSAPMTTEQ